MSLRSSLIVLVAFVLIAGCSSKSGSSSPTAPTPTATTPTPTPSVTAPATPSAPRVDGIRVNGLEYAVNLSWDAVPGATSYIVESVQRQEVETVEVTDTTHEFRREGRSCVAVRAKNAAGVSGLASCRSVDVLDMRDVIEALFFNAGRYAETERPSPLTVMFGWPTGSTVPILVGSNVPDIQHAAMSRAAEQFTRASGINFPPVRSSIVEPAIWERNRIRAIVPPAEQRAVLCPDIGERELEGCAPEWRGRGHIHVGSGRVVGKHAVAGGPRAGASFWPVPHQNAERFGAAVRDRDRPDAVAATAAGTERIRAVRGGGHPARLRQRLSQRHIEAGFRPSRSGSAAVAAADFARRRVSGCLCRHST